MTHHTIYQGRLRTKSYLSGDRVSSFLEKRYGRPISQERPSGSTLISYFRNEEMNILTTECGDDCFYIQVIGNLNQTRNFGKTLKDKFGEIIKEIR